MLPVLWLLLIVAGLTIVVHPFLILRPFWKWQPIRQSDLEQRSSICLADVFSLVFICQLPFALFSLLKIPINEEPIVVPIFLIGGAILWLLGVCEINRIRITGQARRFVGVAITIPLAILCGIGLTSVGAAILNSEQTWQSCRTVLLLGAVYVVITVVARTTATWIVREQTLATDSKRSSSK